MPDAATDPQPTPAQAPPAPPSTPAAPADALRAEDLIGAGMVEQAQRRAATLPQDAAEPGRPTSRGVVSDTDELDDDEYDGLDDDVDEDEGDEPDSDRDAAEDADRFAAILLQQPQRIDEVPRPLRREAIIRSQRAAYEMGMQAGQQAAQAAAGPAQQSNDRAFIDLVDRQRQDDPDAFIEWAEENPQAAARYYAIKSGSPQRPDAPPTAAQQASLSPEQQRLAERATRALGRLAGNAEAQARLQAKADQGAYPPTDEGLEQLLLDIGAEEAAQRSERDVAVRRRAAGERRQRTARPDIQAPRRSSNTPPVTDGPLNVRDLLAQGIKDTQERARNGQIRPAVRA